MALSLFFLLASAGAMTWFVPQTTGALAAAAAFGFGFTLIFGLAHVVGLLMRKTSAARHGQAVKGKTYDCGCG